jgi:hypothetical protein
MVRLGNRTETYDHLQLVTIVRSIWHCWDPCRPFPGTEDERYCNIILCPHFISLFLRNVY